ncbi:MAG TPA: right-handed parallel beta-helix repeat-containing protein [Planctomycetota bacterium]|nr:right-handed parallel beta-helix repeat-containing protein [Planctomycetota bacterium]
MSLLRAVFAGVLAAFAARGQAPAPLVITKDTKLDRGKVYGPIVIAAANVTLDGNGARLEGPGAKSGKFAGAGISARDVGHVVLQRVSVAGFEIGLQIERGEHWRIEDCDFSDNFTDPGFGWGEAPRRGGIVCTGLLHAAIERTKAERNWDACSLFDCDDVQISDCHFAHCSNTCLRLWHSSHNRIERCDLSYGLRIKPGETHARDSTGVLIESGSNGNFFGKNDITHGGDGVFIRVLNNWTSVDNVFEENDASYANNNAFEAWSPRNTYRRNKANHSSYGFWLGASDKTVLIGNEAGWNGDPEGFHNAPEGFGHGGIVFVGGPSSHTLVQDNWCHDNHGGGIVLRGDTASEGGRWKAFHWVIQGNRLERNRCGVHMQFADWIDVGPNAFAANAEGDLQQLEGVTRLTVREANPQARTPPTARLQAPQQYRVGQAATFDASGSTDAQQLPLGFHWDLGDGTLAEQARVEHTFAAPGFYRVGLTVDNGSLASLAWQDVYVVDDVDLASKAENWTWTDDSQRCKVEFRADRDDKLVGDSSVAARVDPYDGMRVSLLYPRGKNAHWSLRHAKHLVFWLRAIDANVPAWQDVNPLVTLWESPERCMRLVPVRDLLSAPLANEGRDGWNYFAVPLAGDALWRREGPQIHTVNWITLGFDSWGAPPLSFWIDGLGLK